MVCECQWGLSGIFLGVFIIAAAGAFTFFPVFLDIFSYDWYYTLCWFWFILGVVLLALGCVWEILGLQSKGRWAQAREAATTEEGSEDVAPTPYIMITA